MKLTVTKNESLIKQKLHFVFPSLETSKITEDLSY